jgi:hypothetical protein
MLHGLDRGLNRSISGHDDDKRLGTLGFNLPENLEAPRPRKSEIEQHGINALSLQQTIGIFGRIGDMRHEPE